MNADAPNSPPTADTLASAAPPATVPAPPAADAPPTPKVLVWPDWFRPFDIALAVFAVLLAFLMASFTARNADLWRHLAAGRLVTQFQYPFGGDPFTFTAEGRPWVNAHWLGEVVLYLLHSIDGSGAVAVGFKAIAFAAAIGLLLRLRKPGAPLWPWAAVAAAGVVAAGGFTHLRPQVFGLPVLAGILLVLYTADWAKGNKWRVPLMLGGLTALWANVDSFAFLSPLLVGLILLGDWLHPKVIGTRGDLPSAEEPFRMAPPRDALGRALLLCAVGVLCNPTFVGGLFRDPVEAVAQLVPHELDWQAAAELEKDEDLGRFTHSALNGAHSANPVLGKNPSGVFAIVLWVAGAVAAGVGYRHGRLSHVLVWLVFALLGAVIHARFVPYGVLVGVPFLAAHLNGMGRWAPRLDGPTDGKRDAVFMGCIVGRVASLLGVVALVVCSLPGWLHPWNGTAAGRRYVGWAVAPDEGMKRSAEVFARWHDDPARKEVLTATRGLNTHPDLGDYLAYHAPMQKSFVTSRYRLHRAELADLVGVRKNTFAPWEAYFAEVAKGQQAARDEYVAAAEQAQKEIRDPTDTAAIEAASRRLEALLKQLQERVEKIPAPVQQGWLVPVADKYGVGYVCVAQAEQSPPQDALTNVRIGFGVNLDEVYRYSSPWQFDGRLLVVGRTRSLTKDEQERYNARQTLPPGEAAEVERMEAAARNRAVNRVMAWDVAREVFAPQPPPPPPPPAIARGIPPQRGWEYDLLFLHPPPRPVGIDDAATTADYASLLESRRMMNNSLNENRWRQRQAERLRVWTTGLTAGAGGAAYPLTLPLAGPQRSFGPLPSSSPTVEPPSEQEFALPFLVARSARQGLIADPNSAAGYLRLAVAFEKPLMPATDAPPDVFGGSPLAPTEADLQAMTALRRALARLPAADKTDAESAPTAVAARLKLISLYLRQGPSQPTIVGLRGTPQKPEPVPQAGPRLGYLDSAVTVLGELVQVVDTLPSDKLDGVARDIVPLWQATLALCQQEFWIGFLEGASRGRVTQASWERLFAGKIEDMLVESDLLKKDDLGDWPAKLAEAARAGNQSESEVRGRLRRVHDVLSVVQNRRKGRLPPVELPTQRFPEAVRSGLPELALRMVEGEQADKQTPVGATPADALRMMLWLGRAEDVQAYFPDELKKVNDTRLSAEAVALERVKFRTIEFELAKLNGDYATADVLFTELLTTPVGDPPQGPSMTAAVFPDLWRAGQHRPLSEAELTLLGQLLDARLPDVSVQLVATGGWAVPSATQVREQLRLRLLFQAYAHYQRGVFALLGGNVARAREQFALAADPQGISKHLPAPPPDAPPEVQKLFPVQRLTNTQLLLPAFGVYLPKYRELLDKYEAK